MNLLFGEAAAAGAGLHHLSRFMARSAEVFLAENRTNMALHLLRAQRGCAGVCEERPSTPSQGC